MKQSTVNTKKHFHARGLDNHFWTRTVVPSVRLLKGNQCEQCGAQDNLDVHHTSYEVQNIHTLKLLCEPCHYQWHRENKVDHNPNTSHSRLSASNEVERSQMRVSQQSGESGEKYAPRKGKVTK